MNEPARETPTRTRVDRSRVLRSSKEIEQFFKEKRWLTNRSNTVQAAYTNWPAAEGQESLQFLFLITKRNVPKAHDRNKLKRWLRAAVHDTGEFELVAAKSRDEDRRIILMLTITRSPEEVDWLAVKADVAKIARQLQERI